MKAISFVVFCAVLVVGCVQANISDQSVCDGQSIMFVLPVLPPVPSGTMGQVDMPQVSTTTSVDFSSALSNVSNIANNVQVSINSMTIDNPNGELSWVHMLEVDMTGSPASQYPQTQLAIYNGGGGSELTPTLTASADTVLQYFKSGQTTLTITLGSSAGTMVDAATVSMLQGLPGYPNVSSAVNVCMSVQGSVSKSVPGV